MPSFATTTARLRIAALLLATLLAETPAAAALEPAPRAALQGKRDDKPKHQHAWVKATRKEWVPPEKKRVQVGVDAKGKPIYETQIVKPGYWKTVTYQRCSCGATKG